MSSSASRLEGGLRSSALTPLLDTLFLLLFTLLATSRSATIVEDALREEVAVELPTVADSSSSGAARDAQQVLTIAVKGSGEVEVLPGQGAGTSASPVHTPAELTAALERASRSAAARVEIRADGAAAHRIVLDVLQAVRRAGITDVRFIALEASAGGSRTFGERTTR
ncbi:MAG: biopolymer transporter ExbD [Planctomycetota bacterium]|nr:biopolymer transporter ExbD [Planctomycetota bacterium]